MITSRNKETHCRALRWCALPNTAPAGLGLRGALFLTGFLGEESFQASCNLQDAARHHAVADLQSLQRPALAGHLLRRLLDFLAGQLAANEAEILEASHDHHTPLDEV